MKLALLAAALVAALAAGSSSAATNECRGLNPCVPVAGPWVVVPTGASIPGPQVQYQLTCPKGFVAAGLDAELSDPAIDVAFLGSSGAPVSPGVTTSRTVVFVATYVGLSPRAPTFRPHIGCVPSQGGGARTPTGVRLVTPPGHPTVRRVVTSHVRASARIVASCHADERLVAWYLARAFATPAPPAPALVASLTANGHAAGTRVTVLARGHRGPAVVQVAAVCAGGR